MKEETKTINGFDITLPVGWGYDPKANRDDYASYITEERGWREIMHHLQALTTVLAPHVQKLQPKRVLHAFGGLGATAQVIRKVAPDAEHIFWERSAQCCEYLRAKKWDSVTQVDNSLKLFEDEDLSSYDVIIFDPSLGTIFSPGIIPAWDVLAKYKTPLIWVSDFATSKLHLNGKAYARVFDGQVCNTAELYCDGYDKFLHKRGKRIVDAIRDSFEMYFIIKPLGRTKEKWRHPIPKMI